jgi:hypothetical protein
MKLPFQETIDGEKRIRIFTEETDSGEFMWHRDRETRIVEVIEGDSWMVQMDDELPKQLIPGEQYIIPEGVYHRVIKGKGNLKVEITFI